MKTTHKTFLKIITASICLLGTALASQAAVIIEDANYSRIYNTDQAGSGTSLQLHTLYVGTKANGAGLDGHAGIAFQMTGATAASLLSADFSISYTGGQGTPIYNVDVYANRVSSSSAFLISDFENGTKLMDDFVTTSDIGSFGNYSLDAGGQANLLSYLQSNWVENDYVFITLKANTDPGFIMGEDANANYNFGGATTYSAGALDAQLTLTVATPEPSTLGLMMMGAALLYSRRRNALNPSTGI